MFLNIFSTVLLPLVLIAGLAFLLARSVGINPRPLSQAVFYLFSPALALVSLANTTLASELLGRLMLLKALSFLIMLPLVYWMANRLKLPASTSSAFALGVLFCNSGNYGLSVNEYAFGQAGLALAVICYVTDNILVNSFGVYIAARGSAAARGQASVRQAVRSVLRNPAFYAVILGLAIHQFGWQAPLPIWRGLESLSRAAVPTMLAVLGMQLAAMPLTRHHWRIIGVASAMRLVLAPVLAIALVIPLGLSGLPRQVAVVETAVPTAVMASIIASQFEVEPNLVASIVLSTSLLSLVTVTALLAWIL